MLALIPAMTMVLGFSSSVNGHLISRILRFAFHRWRVFYDDTNLLAVSLRDSFHPLRRPRRRSLWCVTKQRQGLHHFERTYVMFALGSIVFTGIAIVQSYGDFSANLLIPLASVDFWIPIFFLAGISSVGAFLMLNYAMGHLHVAKASIFGNIATVVAIVAGVVFLNESFGAFQLIGSAIILFSVYGVNR